MDLLLEPRPAPRHQLPRRSHVAPNKWHIAEVCLNRAVRGSTDENSSARDKCMLVCFSNLPQHGKCW